MPPDFHGLLPIKTNHGPVQIHILSPFRRRRLHSAFNPSEPRPLHNPILLFPWGDIHTRRLSQWIDTGKAVV